MAFIKGIEVLFSGRFGNTNVPTARKPISKNGEYDVTDFAKVEVKVEADAPEGYIKPSGAVYISTNGEHDVGSAKTAIVNVPTGNTTNSVLITKTFTKNGTYPAINYGANGFSTVTVNVPTSNPTQYLTIDAAYLAANNKKEIDVSNVKTIYINIATLDNDEDM